MRSTRGAFSFGFLYRPAAPIIITTDSAMSIAPSAAAMDSVLCSSVSAVTERYTGCGSGNSVRKI